MLLPLLILYLLLAGGDPTTSSTESAAAPLPADPGQIRAAGPPGAYWGSWIDGDVYDRSDDAPWDGTTWDRFEEAAGKGVSILHFGQPAPWLQEFDPLPSNRALERGAIPLVDMDPDGTALEAIASGRHDAAITAWAEAVRDHARPLFLRWAWEMDGSWFQWGEEAAEDPGDYVAAWRHLHDLVQEAGATNVTWVWCPSTVHSGSTPLPELYPGGHYVDWTCMDGYNFGLSRGPDGAWRSFTEIFDQTYRELLDLAPAKPVMIGEVGTTEVGGSKPAWIRDALGTQLPTRFPRVKALVWFNWNILEGGERRDWQIESSPGSEEAFSEAIAAPYYAGPLDLSASTAAGSG